jgi:molybdate transport system permease protein
MDWQALALSLELAAATLLVLLPIGLCLGRWLAYSRFVGKSWVEALVVLPLVLPPTVLGYYLLVSLGGDSPLGRWLARTFDVALTFNFAGLLLASIIFNLPFMVQPVQRAFEAIPRELGEAAAVSGLGAWNTFWRIDLPLAWPGVLSAMVLTFVHTLGEFGVVLMIGGNIPGETKVLSIAIYDFVERGEWMKAHWVSGGMVLFAFVVVTATMLLDRRFGRLTG